MSELMTDDEIETAMEALRNRLLMGRTVVQAPFLTSVTDGKPMTRYTVIDESTHERPTADTVRGMCDTFEGVLAKAGMGAQVTWDGPPVLRHERIDKGRYATTLGVRLRWED